MATTAQSIINSVAVTLQDTGFIRWTAAELLQWLNDGQREIAMLLPEASTTFVNFTLVGGTKQTIPANGTRLISVVRNVTGTRRAIRLVDRMVLDAQKPTWHSETGATTITHYCFDPRVPKNFYVYPPAAASGAGVELVYSIAPTNLTSASANIGLDDIYVNALTDYILYRAYLKDAEYTMNAERAKLHYEAFGASLGVKNQTDATVEPVPPGSTRPALGISG